MRTIQHAVGWGESTCTVDEIHKVQAEDYNTAVRGCQFCRRKNRSRWGARMGWKSTRMKWCYILELGVTAALSESDGKKKARRKWDGIVVQRAERGTAAIKTCLIMAGACYKIPKSWRPRTR
jgi:hypothetical protein